jgi:hypothetical protein
MSWNFKKEQVRPPGPAIDFGDDGFFLIKYVKLQEKRGKDRE